MVQQQKALLVLAQEQMQVIELEQRLVQAEAARSMLCLLLLGGCADKGSHAGPQDHAVQGEGE
jgi:hypothetical protein